MTTSLAGVEIVHWNPRRNSLPILGRFEIGRRVGNFGDLLGPMVAERVVHQANHGGPPAGRRRRLLTVGSIMHFAVDGDSVWGTGVNGKIPFERHPARDLDVRAVRGPLTREWLWKNLRVDSPEVFGDPALLLPQLMPDLVRWSQTKTRRLSLIPNLHDVPACASHPAFVSPRSDVRDVLRSIAESEAVIGSSLHAMIIAESLGIPAVLVRATAEPDFKYLDYAGGTGRSALPVSDTVDEAERAVMGMKAAELDWNAAPLLAAFPHNLWGPPPTP